MAALLTSVFLIGMRFKTGIWHWSAITYGGVLGAFLGAGVGMAGRFPSHQQEIELRVNDFSIRGTKEVSMRYDQLRGYSIITQGAAGQNHRALLLYPENESGLFSIGIEPSVTDEMIHARLSSHTGFRTFVDDQAFKIV